MYTHTRIQLSHTHTTFPMCACVYSYIYVCVCVFQVSNELVHIQHRTVPAINNKYLLLFYYKFLSKNPHRSFIIFSNDLWHGRTS